MITSGALHNVSNNLLILGRLQWCLARLGWDLREWEEASCLSELNEIDCLHFSFIPCASCAWFLLRQNLMRFVTWLLWLKYLGWKVFICSGPL